VTSQPRANGRTPGAAVITELVRVRAAEAPRSVVDRAFGLNSLSSAARPWYVGASAEIKVGRLLGTLPARWTTFHSMPVGSRGSDIDHLVVGAAGVFVINTKSTRQHRVRVYANSVWINGHKKPFIRNSHYEASRVTKLLAPLQIERLTVHPILAFVGASSLTIATTPDLVVALDSRRLVSHLLRQPTRLSDNQIDEIRAHINGLPGWETAVVDPAPAPAFSQVKSEVHRARRVRLCWILGLATAPAAILAGLPPLLA
jgi:hypothetical protein